MIFCMTMTEPSSQQDAAVLENCIARMACGDREALATLYRYARVPVYGLAMSILKNHADAEDVLQDCLIRVWSAADRYQPQGKPMAWILTIARHLAYDRTYARTRTQDMREGDWQAIPDGQPNVTAEDRITLETLLNTLGDQERQIVVLHALAGLKHREIADMLELPLATVLSKYHRTMKKLQQTWKEADEHALS